MNSLNPNPIKDHTTHNSPTLPTDNPIALLSWFQKLCGGKPINSLWWTLAVVIMGIGISFSSYAIAHPEDWSRFLPNPKPDEKRMEGLQKKLEGSEEEIEALIQENKDLAQKNKTLEAELQKIKKNNSVSLEAKALLVPSPKILVQKEGVIQLMPTLDKNGCPEIANSKGQKFPQCENKNTSYSIPYKELQDKLTCEINLTVFDRKWKHKPLFAQVELQEPNNSYSVYCLVSGTFENDRKVGTSSLKEQPIPLLLSQRAANDHLNIKKGNYRAKVSLITVEEAIQHDRQNYELYEAYRDKLE